MTRTFWFWAGLSSLLLLGFFGLKVLRFNALYYTYNDMYIFLQSSCSWIDGRPLLYENVWGYSGRIHNNYILLLMGPLIYVGGAYGAFAVQVGLLLISYVLLIRYVSKGAAGWTTGLLTAVLLLGPVPFWFNEHPNIGWHPELTYWPLTLLFALALMTGRRWAFALTAAGLVFVKEDGALLAGVVHIGYLSLGYLRANPTRSIWGVLTTGRFWRVVVRWALVFGAGMAFLAYKNHAAQPEPRLQQALAVVQNGLRDPTFIRVHGRLLFHTLLLLLPTLGLLGYGLARNGWRQVGSVLLGYGGALAVLTVSNGVQGATYYGTNPLFDLVSLTWPPRFVLVWAFSAAYVLFYWRLFRPDARPVLSWQPALLGALLWVVQGPVVQAARPDERFSPLFRNLRTYRYDPQKLPLLPAADVAVVGEVARTIPPRSSVYVFDYLIPLFHRHYNIWPTGKHWARADVAVIPNNDFQKLGDRLPRVMNAPYRAFRLGTYTIYATPKAEPAVRQAIARSFSNP